MHARDFCALSHVQSHNHDVADHNNDRVQSNGYSHINAPWAHDTQSNAVFYLLRRIMWRSMRSMRSMRGGFIFRNGEDSRQQYSLSTVVKFSEDLFRLFPSL